MLLQIPNQQQDNLITRRGIFMGAAASLIFAPAIVRATSLMQVRKIILPIKDASYPGPQYAGFVERLRYDFLDKALRHGWDDKRHGRVVGGMSENDTRKAVAHAYAQGWLKGFSINGGPNG